MRRQQHPLPLAPSPFEGEGVEKRGLGDTPRTPAGNLGFLHLPVSCHQVRQRGFTFLELAVAMAIMALILPLLAASARQITFDTDRNVTRITALTNVERAIFRLGREIPQAQATDLADPTVNATSIMVYWTDWTDASNYDSYDAAHVAYKRVRATYSLSGTDLVRTVGTCANQKSDDVACTLNVVTGGGWANNTKWVAGEPAVLSTDSCSPTCSLNAASRVADPASPATVARSVVTAQFSRSGTTFTIKLKAQPKTSDQPAEERTYTIIGPLLDPQAAVGW